MKVRWVLAAALGVAVLLTAVVVRDRAPVRSEYCVAKVGELRAQVDLEQARWSALMAAQSQRRGMPPRATTIAIATAYQESKIRNIDYGDRDSLGLFQQRPSQGWGTPEEVMDPHHSIEEFYAGLDKVDGYATMEITAAAQRVQRSAYPRAYADHEPFARALASSLRGYSPAAFTCQINPGAGGSARAVINDVFDAFGEIDVQRTGDDAKFPLAGALDDVEARGWALAHYLVAVADPLGIKTVTFADRRWSADESEKGWQPRETVERAVVRFSTN